jgi:hypothetical protein
MTTPPTDAYFVRRGFDAEIERHRANALRALNEVQRNLYAASDSLGGEPNAQAFRQLVVDAAEAAQQAAALSAVLEIAKFARPEES